MRRIAPVLVFLLLVGLPNRADAQLRTWCSSPTGDICLNVFSFSFAASAFDGGTLASWTITGYWSGGGFGAMTNPTWQAFLRIPFDPYPYVARMSDYPSQEYIFPNMAAVQWRSIGFASLPPSSLTHTPTLADITQIVLYDNGRTVAAWNPNTVVPEPSTVILLGTGLLAIGFVAWRRKEEKD